MATTSPAPSGPHAAGTEDERDALLETVRLIDRWGTERGWRGSDPYDGLNATRLVGPLRRSVLGRRLVTQSVKRSPIDLRGALGVPEGVNSVALAQVASSYAIADFLAPELRRERLERTLAALLAMRVGGFDEPCWSYHWDLQTRVFFYPKTDPNAIATAFAGLAFLDGFEHTGDDALLRIAVGAGDFFLRHVPQTETAGGAFFGYLVDDRTPIHNANMLVCALLARAGRHADRPDFLAAARRGVEYAVNHQRADGSWPYGEQPHTAWIDNFHTGYVLDCLMACGEAEVGVELGPAIERGLEYYRRELFLPDGTPRYYAGSTYPIDIQGVAQGIQTFAIASAAHPRMLDQARLVCTYAMTRMRRRDGLFMFQRRRLWANRQPHMRWVMAPMTLALAHLLRATAR